MSQAGACCPNCGQRLLIRHGVRLSPRLADIFDVIAHSGKYGIEPEVLAGVLYPGKPLGDARRCIATNVAFINLRFEETDLRLRASRGSPYRLLRKSTSDAA